MTSSSIPGLRTAGHGDIDQIADLIADAFDHLEVIDFLVPDPGRRRSVSRDWYRLHVAHAIGGAGQVVTTENGTAAAVWFDRTGEATEPDDYEKHLAELTGEHLGRFQRLDRQMDAYHPSDPHWHLLFLAVRRGRWSQGLGSALMDHTHTHLDAQGIPAYLEATSEQNRRLYRRHGYTDMTPPIVPVADGVSLYRMWRPAERG